MPTRSIEGQMTALASQMEQGCDITICALAEAIPYASGQIQVTLLRVGKRVVHFSFGIKFFVYTVLYCNFISTHSWTHSLSILLYTL